MQVIKEDIPWRTSECESTEYSQIKLDNNQTRKREAGPDGERTQLTYNNTALKTAAKQGQTAKIKTTVTKTMDNQVLTDLTSVACRRPTTLMKTAIVVYPEITSNESCALCLFEKRWIRDTIQSSFTA